MMGSVAKASCAGGAGQEAAGKFVGFHAAEGAAGVSLMLAAHADQLFHAAERGAGNGAANSTGTSTGNSTGNSASGEDASGALSFLACLRPGRHVFAPPHPRLVAAAALAAAAAARFPVDELAVDTGAAPQGVDSAACLPVPPTFASLFSWRLPDVETSDLVDYSVSTAQEEEEERPRCLQGEVPAVSGNRSNAAYLAAYEREPFLCCGIVTLREATEVGAGGIPEGAEASGDSGAGRRRRAAVGAMRAVLPGLGGPWTAAVFPLLHSSAGFNRSGDGRDTLLWEPVLAEGCGIVGSSGADASGEETSRGFCPRYNVTVQEEECPRGYAGRRCEWPQASLLQSVGWQWESRADSCYMPPSVARSRTSVPPKPWFTASAASVAAESSHNLSVAAVGSAWGPLVCPQDGAWLMYSLRVSRFSTGGALSVSLRLRPGGNLSLAAASTSGSAVVARGGNYTGIMDQPGSRVALFVRRGGAPSRDRFTAGAVIEVGSTLGRLRQLDATEAAARAAANATSKGRRGRETKPAATNETTTESAAAVSVGANSTAAALARVIVAEVPVSVLASEGVGRFFVAAEKEDALAPRQVRLRWSLQYPQEGRWYVGILLLPPPPNFNATVAGRANTTGAARGANASTSVWPMGVEPMGKEGGCAPQELLRAGELLALLSPPATTPGSVATSDSGAAAVAAASWSSVLQLQVYTGGCVLGLNDLPCSGNGTCREKATVSGQDFYSVCNCYDGYGGSDCSIKFLDEKEIKTHGFALTLSNAVALLPSLWSLWHKLYLEAAVYFLAGFFSAVYHVCDSGMACAMPYATMQFADFVLAYFCVLVTLVHLCYWDGQPKLILLVTGLMSICLSIYRQPTSVRGVLMLAALAAVSLSWPLLCRWVCCPPKEDPVAQEERASLREGDGDGDSRCCRGPCMGLAPGAWCRSRGCPLVLAIASGTLSILSWALEMPSNYWLLHSLWHVSIFLAAFFFLWALSPVTMVTKWAPVYENVGAERDEDEEEEGGARAMQRPPSTKRFAPLNVHARMAGRR